MQISIKTHLLYSAEQPCDLLLQIEAMTDAEQDCTGTEFAIQPEVASRIVQGEEQVGQRRWIHVERSFECLYQTCVLVDRQALELGTLHATPLPLIPGDVTKFLMPSRYCNPSDFITFSQRRFGVEPGGEVVLAMSEWIKRNFIYDNGASDSSTNAIDSFTKRRGVCRDYAHVLISMARAVGIPARFVSAYAPDVVPQDFHAVAEVYLGGQWHLVDPTGMAQVSEIVRIGIGRDAADVSFMTSYGRMELINQSIQVSRLG